MADEQTVTFTGTAEELEAKLKELQAQAGPGGVARLKLKGHLSAVVTRADGTKEDLGIIARTEDGTLTADLASPKEG